MKSLSINSCNFGSTGKIMLHLADRAQQSGYEVTVAYPDSRSNRRNTTLNSTLIGNRVDRNLHILLGKLTGAMGLFSVISTSVFLRKLSKERPVILHLHNLHGSYINLPMLFHFVKRNRIPVIWTLHDCWSFTGHCPHFTMAKCEKWKTGCHHCPQYREYPQSFVDNSQYMYRLKKKWFTGIENMTIVTPSQWLADLVKESFLKEYPVKVIHNGIDLEIFKPTPSDFREKYGISEEKKILLGVSFGWGVRKGLDVFAELSKRLDYEQYQIVLVGTDDKVDQQLPENIISIHRTNNQQELAAIYTAADLFLNPTREDNYPTVNMEAISCGTPVLTFRTGGSPEILDEYTGAVVDCDDVTKLVDESRRICTDKPFSQDACMARAKCFDIHGNYKRYLMLYEQVTAVD